MPRTDKPIIDADEQYVFHTAPGVAVPADGRVHNADLSFGWDAKDPFVFQMSIQLLKDSVPVTAEEFPEGLICGRCLLPIEPGSVAQAVGTGEQWCGTDVDALWCVACARDSLEILDEATWNISLKLLRGWLAGVNPKSQDVRMTRPTSDTMCLRLGRYTFEYMFLNIPVQRLSQFVKAIDQFMTTADRHAIEDAYLETSIDAIEQFVNRKSE
jgi:hypothetical protein